MTKKQIDVYWAKVEADYLAALPPRQQQSVLEWAAPFEECSLKLQSEILAALVGQSVEWLNKVE